MELEALLSQLPNFGGLILCVMYLWRDGDKKRELIEHLVNVIVKRENCDDEDPKG